MLDTVLPSGTDQTIYTSFTINSDPIIFYEYAIGIEMNNTLTNTAGTWPYVLVYGEDANYTYPVSLSVPVQNEYEYYTGVETVALYPSGVPYLTQNAIVGITYSSATNPITSGNVNPGDSTVTFILTNINNQIAPGLTATLTAGATSIPGKVVGVDIINPKQITIQLDFPPYLGPLVSLIGGNLAVATQGFNGALGKLYANTIEGTEIKQFYTDAAFTQKWVPPVANRFYVFQTSKNYNPEGATFPPLKYSEYPYYCARFDGNGKVIEQLGETPDMQTAWVGQNAPNTAVIPIDNYSYNVFYDPTV